MTVSLARAVELQVLLEGIPLPATRDQLIAWAREQDADAAATLEALPDRAYERLDDVGEALAPTSVRRPEAEPVPWPESGKPPGGPDYLNPSPEPGRVR